MRAKNHACNRQTYAFLSSVSWLNASLIYGFQVNYNDDDAWRLADTEEAEKSAEKQSDDDASQDWNGEDQVSDDDKDWELELGVVPESRDPRDTKSQAATKALALAEVKPPAEDVSILGFKPIDRMRLIEV